MKRTKDQKKKLIEDYRSSGLTQKVWCEKNNIKIFTLRYWLRHEDTNSAPKQSTQPISWVEIKPPSSNQYASGSVKVSVKDFTIVLGGALEMQMLKDILRVMKEIC